MHRDEKPLGNGTIKVWRHNAQAICLHHKAGLTIELNDLEEIELFQWLHNDLRKRGLLPSLPVETIDAQDTLDIFPSPEDYPLLDERWVLPDDV